MSFFGCFFIANYESRVRVFLFFECIRRVMYFILLSNCLLKIYFDFAEIKLVGLKVYLNNSPT